MLLDKLGPLYRLISKALSRPASSPASDTPSSSAESSQSSMSSSASPTPAKPLSRIPDPTLDEIVSKAMEPAFALLPAKMDTKEARCMMLAIGLQESRFQHRQQIGGPARGFWQFEKGTPTTRGGVCGVVLHDQTRDLVQSVCKARGVPATADAIYAALDKDDVLAAAIARLLLWTDPKPLPALGETDQAWDLYARTWRPGKPHRQTWNALYNRAMEAVR